MMQHHGMLALAPRPQPPCLLHRPHTSQADLAGQRGATQAELDQHVALANSLLDLAHAVVPAHGQPQHCLALAPA